MVTALGINSAYHESSACLVRDGVVVAAVEEERFSRRKHGKDAEVDNPHQLPLASIGWCLRHAGVEPGDVARIGYSLNPLRRLANRIHDEDVVAGSWGSVAGEDEFHRCLQTIPERLLAMGFGARLAWIDHHRCHAASAYLASPWEHAAVLTMDGIGETASTTFAVGQGQHIEFLGAIEYPASLGFLWEKLSMFLGFREHDACKVMGLSAYGDPERFRAAFAQVVSLLPEGRFAIDNDVMRFRGGGHGRLEALFGVPRRLRDEPLEPVHSDLAAALQKVTSSTALHLARYLRQQTATKRLCLAGGVALNCVMNQALLDQAGFDELYVSPAAHDAGTALGAALLLSPGAQRSPLEHVYLGPCFSAAEVESTLAASGLPYQRYERIEEAVAERLANGQIVGWFNGAMEFGPRALGNRSLLADPRHASVREKLNEAVKHREPFRPFGPSVLCEEAAKWFELPDSPATEYMLLAVRVRNAYRDRIPAVVHVDGTSRLQVVSRSQNPRYHAVIAAFYARTGVPAVLNTSFNDDEPIVCTPADALATFRSTAIDCLAIEGFLVERPRTGQAVERP